MNPGGVVEDSAKIGGASSRSVERRPYGIRFRARQHRELGAVVVLGCARYLRKHAGKGERDPLVVSVNQYRARVRASRPAVSGNAPRKKFDSLC